MASDSRTPKKSLFEQLNADKEAPMKFDRTKKQNIELIADEVMKKLKPRSKADFVEVTQGNAFRTKRTKRVTKLS